MSYTVKLAKFPLWKAPAPYETLDEVFATTANASIAAENALAFIVERELAELALQLRPISKQVGEQVITAIGVPDVEVHGYIIYDDEGVEVFNWTTLDIAIERAANG